MTMALEHKELEYRILTLLVECPGNFNVIQQQSPIGVGTLDRAPKHLVAQALIQEVSWSCWLQALAHWVRVQSV
jgi:hypothetical protein